MAHGVIGEAIAGWSVTLREGCLPVPAPAERKRADAINALIFSMICRLSLSLLEQQHKHLMNTAEY